MPTLECHTPVRAYRLLSARPTAFIPQADVTQGGPVREPEHDHIEVWRATYEPAVNSFAAPPDSAAPPKAHDHPSFAHHRF